MKKYVLSVLTLFLSAVPILAMKTPETSSLFEKWTDPENGVVSYRLRDNMLAPNQQSVYFVNKSMTEDGRFILFWIAGDERFGKVRKEYALIDFEKDTAFRLNIKRGDTFSVDVRTDILYYVNTEGVFKRELLVDPMKEIKICDIPSGLKAEGEVRHFFTHLTMNRDATKIFVDARVEGTDRWIQGIIDINSCSWEKWNETDFVINHGQLHPFREDIALCAHETQWTDTKGVHHKIQNVDGIYPRLQLIEPGKRTMVPPLRNYATHERWDEQGAGFYWCNKGVTYCNLSTMEQEDVSPYGEHAMMSIDKRYVVADVRIGNFYRGSPWRVVMWSRDRNKLVYLATSMPGIATPAKPSRLHPDPHPQFVCGDKYVIWTLMGADSLMHFMVTPMDGIVARMDRKPLGELPDGCEPETVFGKISGVMLDRAGEYRHMDNSRSVTSLCAAAMQVATKLGDRNMEKDFRHCCKERAWEDVTWKKDIGRAADSTPLDKYCKRMEKLLSSRKKDGLWGDRNESARIVYAFIEGVNNGWLPADKFVPVAREAWLKLCGMQDAFTSCNPEFQAPMMWICSALL